MTNREIKWPKKREKGFFFPNLLFAPRNLLPNLLLSLPEEEKHRRLQLFKPILRPSRVQDRRETILTEVKCPTGDLCPEALLEVLLILDKALQIFASLVHGFPSRHNAVNRSLFT